MAELTSKFSRSDIETLIEAMGDWELIGNNEFHVLQMIKNVPLPPEDHEAFEMMTQIKDHFRKREKDIMASRQTRQEKSTFLKAKLMMVRQELGINALFEMATTADEEQPKTASKPNVPNETLVKVSEELQAKLNQAELRLKQAETYVKQIGAEKYYLEYLKSLEQESS